MKINRTSFIIAGISVLFLGLLMVVTIGSKDSKEHQFARRLADFKAALPQDMVTAFTNGNLPAVTGYLQKKVTEYKSFTNILSATQRIFFLKAEFQSVDKDRLQKVPKELVQFYTKYYKVLDQECIQGFTEEETVAYFKQYFAEWLKKHKQGIPQVDLN